MKIGTLCWRDSFSEIRVSEENLAGKLTPCCSVKICDIRSSRIGYFQISFPIIYLIYVSSDTNVRGI